MLHWFQYSIFCPTLNGSHMCIWLRWPMGLCMCVCVHAFVRVCASARMRVCVCACMRAWTHACVCFTLFTTYLHKSSLKLGACIAIYFSAGVNLRNSSIYLLLQDTHLYVSNHVSTNPPLPVVKIGQCVVHALVILCVCVCAWVHACMCVCSDI